MFWYKECYGLLALKAKIRKSKSQRISRLAEIPPAFVSVCCFCQCSTDHATLNFLPPSTKDLRLYENYIHSVQLL